ncbi:HotDog domain-containing protein, partial [Dimargaris cristalligena]
PRRLAINEVIFNNQTDDVMTQIQYLGRSLCGHDGIIHGGLLATIVDEAFARLAFAFLPGHSGFTANLNVDYRSPVPADIMVVLVISIDRVDGRKVFLKARMSSLDGKFTFLESTSLYIAPR